MQLIKDQDNVRTYKLKNDEVIIIEVDDSGDRIEVTGDNGIEIGSFDMQELDNGNHYITWMFLNKTSAKYLRQGIGREALKFFKDYFGTKIYAADNDGFQKNDGSHLTGDAPGFVSQMKKEGIIEENN